MGIKIRHWSLHHKPIVEKQLVYFSTKHYEYLKMRRNLVNEKVRNVLITIAVNLGQ